MRQAPNCGKLLCRFKLKSQHKSHEVENCRKNCVSCPDLLKTSLCLFKRVNKTFFLKNSFNCKSSNLTYVVICQGCKKEYIGETGFLLKERINVYRQHIRQPQSRQLSIEEHLRICGDGKLHMFPFFKIVQENKTLRKSYEDYFIDKFKPLLNKKASLAKLTKVTVLKMTSASCLIPTIVCKKYLEVTRFHRKSWLELKF